jgi:hypothetical protein
MKGRTFGGINSVDYSIDEKVNFPIDVYFFMKGISHDWLRRKIPIC